MQTIPLAAVSNQTVSATLGGQAVTLNIYQKATGLYMDVILAGVVLLTGVACLNQVVIVRSAYFGFVGDLAFYDLQGSTDPSYTGFGSRYLLLYLEAADLANQTIT